MNCLHEHRKAADSGAPAWPAWANWRAMDANGEWHFYEDRPVCLRSVWGAVIGGERLAPPAPIAADWRQSLEQRP